MTTNRFIGDDLPRLLQVNRPQNTDNITITKSIVQIGDLKFEGKNPIFPYYISVPRAKCRYLDTKNPIYMGVYYLDANGKELFQTCVGSLTLPLNKAVIKEGC